LGEVAVPGDAAEQHAEIDASGHGSVRTDPDSSKTDVIGCFEDGDAPAAVEGDVEFAWQAIKLAVI
jgi:hypothetical protein